MSRIAVLYEDQLATSKPRSFGPHVLVLACLADRLQRPREHLEHHIDAHPCKGIGRLLALCREPLLADRHAVIFAVCDDDRVREHLKLPATACKLEVRETVAAGLGSPRLQTVLLARNLETVLAAVLHVLGLDPIADKPSPLKRDGILLRLAYKGTPDQRLALLQRVPSFAYLVDRLTGTIVALGL